MKFQKILSIDKFENSIVVEFEIRFSDQFDRSTGYTDDHVLVDDQNERRKDWEEQLSQTDWANMLTRCDESISLFLKSGIYLKGHKL